MITAMQNISRMRLPSLLRRNVPSSCIEGRMPLSELFCKTDEAAVSRANDVVEAVLLGDLRLEHAILAGAEEVVVGVDRVQLVVLARRSMAGDAGQLGIEVRVLPGIQECCSADVRQAVG